MEIGIRVLQVMGILIGVVLCYLSVVTFFPGFNVPGQPLRAPKTKTPTAQDTALPATREDVVFEVNGTTVRAWLYLPENRPVPVPCIVMGHGTGGTREMLLERYAVRYREAGYAVLAFDYRFFGESDGEPRQLLWIPCQLEDYTATIRYARTRKEIDPAKIALWGTSLSGGHVIVTAAREPHIACVVAQCPGVDGRASAEMGLKRLGLGYVFRMVVHGQRDFFRSWVGLSPHKIPIVGQPGSLALMNTEEAYALFTRDAPKGYVNEVCARILLRVDKYRPVKHARNVRCPVLLQVCEKDNLIPKRAVEETAKELGTYALVKSYPIGHFDIYAGEHLERSLSDQLAFLKKHL